MTPRIFRRLLAPILLLSLLLASCATTGTASLVGSASLEADTKPMPIFSDRKFGSVSVQSFDAKGVETYRGSVVDYVELARNFTDDLVRRFYEGGKVRVTFGETLDSMVISDLVERRVGDINVKRNELGTSVTMKSSPFRKVDIQLSGRITRFQSEIPANRSYVEIYLRVTDTYDGTVFWITRLRGSWENVIKTLVDTVTTGVWTPAATASEVSAGTNAAPAVAPAAPPSPSAPSAPAPTTR